MPYSMICYPHDIRGKEVELLNKYWELNENDFAKFKYLVVQLQQGSGEGIRSLNKLIEESCFLMPDLPWFTCSRCAAPKPVKNRAEFSRRLKMDMNFVCSKCRSELVEKELLRAQKIIQEYKDTSFPAEKYLDDLTFEQTLSLLSLISNKQQGDVFLGRTPEDIVITGVEAIDSGVIKSLIHLRALVYLDEIPEQVEYANLLINGDYQQNRYGYRTPHHVRQRENGLLEKGVYINAPVLDEQIRATDLNTLFYSKLISSQISLEEVRSVERLVRGVQFHKLYQLTSEISHEFRIEIENSNVLRSLLEHLAGKYAPNKVYYAFRLNINKAIVYLRKSDVNSYAEKHLFSRFVANYIEYLESNKYEITNSYELPPIIEISPFEAIFSQIYLDDYFSFNGLSAKDVVLPGWTKYQCPLTGATWSKKHRIVCSFSCYTIFIYSDINEI